MRGEGGKERKGEGGEGREKEEEGGERDIILAHSFKDSAGCGCEPEARPRYEGSRVRENNCPFHGKGEGNSCSVVQLVSKVFGEHA